MSRPHVLEHGRHAVAPGYRTRFSADGLRWIEPRFLALEEAAGGRAHGVVFDIDEDEWEQMSHHEITYEPREIEVFVDGEALVATALVLREQDQVEEGVPSARYAAMLVTGARHHGLPDELVDRYEQLQRTGPKLTCYLGPFMGLVRLFVPWFGPGGAATLAAVLVFGVPLALLGGLAWWGLR